jgi:O-antigen ligase
LLIIPVGISITSSYNQGTTILTFIALILFVFVAISMSAGFKSEQSHEDFQKWFLWIYLFFIFDGLLQFFSGQSLFGVVYEAGSSSRLLGASGDDLHYGIFLSVLMPLALWRICRQRPITTLGVIVLSIFLVSLSGARTSIFFAFMSAFILLIRFAPAYRTILVVTALASVLIAYHESPTVKSKFTQMEQFDLSERSLDRLLSWRVSIWRAGMSMLDSHPLTGIGANSFAEAYPSYRVNYHDPLDEHGIYHAHQLYVGLAAETGWPGLAGFLLIIASVLFWWRRAMDVNRRLAAPYAASLGVIIFPINSQPVLYTLWWFPLVLLLFVGMVSALSHDPYGKS